MVELLCCLIFPLAMVAGWCIEAGVDVYFWAEERIDARIKAWRQTPEEPFPYGLAGIRALDCVVLFGLLFVSLFGLTLLFYYAISVGAIVTPAVVVGLFLFLWMFSLSSERQASRPFRKTLSVRGESRFSRSPRAPLCFRR